jgi:2-methylcitrate dehydratase
VIDRRALLLAAGAAAATTAASRSTTALAAESADSAALDTTPAVTNVTAELIQFARSLRYEDLPEPVVHAAKRYILDTLGCAVAGHETDKGKIAVRTIAALGGTPEARILGSGQRVSVTNAAFANGELTNALDYDAIPHIPPFVVPPLLAMAEKTHASGKALILAVVVAHEVAARLSAAAGQHAAGATDDSPHPVWGINDESIMAAAAGLASLLHLDEAAALSAVGLAGYYCPPRSSDDWQVESPLTMVKYTPAGWICQGAVTAALLAQAGFSGPQAVLDGPTGFPYYYGWENWKPHGATADLGRVWRIQTVDFKPYACCRFLHSQIDCLIALVNAHQLRPRQIEKITSVGVPLPANPDKMNVRTQPDAQFSTPYMLALAASGIPLDARCQSHERLHDPDIRSLMSRITWGKHPEADASRREHPNAYIARVEVVADGQTFVEERLYPSGTASAGFALSDDILNEKALKNFSTVLSPAAAHGAREMIWRLEEYPDISRLVDKLS